MTPMAAAPEGNVKQAEPEKEDIMVMDTKLKIIEILQVTISQAWWEVCFTGLPFGSAPPCSYKALDFLGESMEVNS